MFRAHRRRRFSRLRALTAILVIVLAGAAVTLTIVLNQSGSAAPRTVMSLFQDDQLLLYSPTPIVERALGTLSSLGVDRLRVMITWAYVAPDPTSRERPARFIAANPADYRPGGWRALRSPCAAGGPARDRARLRRDRSRASVGNGGSSAERPLRDQLPRLTEGVRAVRNRRRPALQRPLQGGAGSRRQVDHAAAGQLLDDLE